MCMKVLSTITLRLSKDQLIRQLILAIRMVIFLLNSNHELNIHYITNENDSLIFLILTVYIREYLF